MTRQRMFYVAGTGVLSLALCASGVAFGQEKKDEKENRPEKAPQAQHQQEPNKEQARPFARVGIW